MRRRAAASGFSSSVFLARGDRLHRGVDQRDLRRKEIAKQSGNAPGDIDAGAADRGGRQHFDAGDAAAGVVPDRPAAHQRKALRDFLAAGAQRGAAPQIDDDGARHVAVGLQMRAHDFVGGEAAELHRGRRRQRARIGGEEIAAGRQHVAPPARRRAGRARRDAAAVERRDQRRALGLGARVPSRIVDTGWRAAVDVQAVLDGEVLEIAQPGIDAAQRLVGRRPRRRRPASCAKAGALRRLDDQRREPLAPPPVEAVGLGVFVEQAFKLVRVAARPAGDQRRRQMADGQAGDAALGLRRLARIADDERIDHRQRTGDDFGKAFRGQRDRLARQPFQRAVRAHVHERIGLRHVLQPQPERDQRVARRQRRIVIIGAALRRGGRDRAAARPGHCRNSWRGNERRRRAHRDRPPARPRPRAGAPPRRSAAAPAGLRIARW